MKKANAPILIALTIGLVASACMVTLPAAQIAATPTPDLALTGKAQTLTSAPTITSTVTIVPNTPTPTITLTSFPTITPLPTATATFTETPFGFAFSPTPDLTQGSVTPDPADGATDDFGSDYRCNLLSKDPETGAVLPGKSLYKASWKLYNSGKKRWQAGDMTLAFLGGERFDTEKSYKLIKDVKVGDSISPNFTITIPKDPGNYRSVWGLQLVRNEHVFCTFTINITVQ